ncbi:glycosyltransferase family 4 protein [Hyphomicrobium sp.]|uniref:glycosyltransferase family 4 protein n=1 Tax=Hyphomicrobium sp. TaxID=82 RepID=UPI002D787739|nr:glycosyltransferase family 4 protein [Hyphomicrobium sp.]HET6389073.1 glycosyltransferase family 4 protein [Hyphomicrobium sp.]
MRILHCFRAPVGGLFRHVLDLAEAQASRGHDVGILAGSTAEDRLTAGKFAALAPKLTLGIARIPMKRMPGMGDFAAVHATFRHARQLDLDVIHGHGAKGGAYARLASYGLSVSGRDVKSFYTPHGGSLNFKPGTLESKFLLSVERNLDSMTTGIIFESEYAAQKYALHVGGMVAPQRIIPNGLGTSDFTPAVADAHAKDVLFVGELRQLKGVDVLLKAIADVRRSRAITAAIVGSGPEGEDLRSLATSLGLDDVVHFTGAMPAREAFKLGRVMVVPSRAESFPYIVLEASAAGLPLIATNVGGIPEIVAGMDTQLIEAGDVDQLARALIDTLDNMEAARERASRLKAKVQTTYTVSAMTDAVLDFYEKAEIRRAQLPLRASKLLGQRG